MAVYSRVHLADFYRRKARRLVCEARMWRLEAEAPFTYCRPSQSRAYARKALLMAGAARRRALVFANLPSRYVDRERYRAIMRGEW